MSSLPPPGTFLQFLTRIGFSIPTARRFSSNVVATNNSRSLSRFPRVNLRTRKSPYEFIRVMHYEILLTFDLNMTTRLLFNNDINNWFPILASLVFLLVGKKCFVSDRRWSPCCTLIVRWRTWWKQEVLSKFSFFVLLFLSKYMPEKWGKIGI